MTARLTDSELSRLFAVRGVPSERTIRRWRAKGPPDVVERRIEADMARAIALLSFGAHTGASLGEALGRNERWGRRMIRRLIDDGKLQCVDFTLRGDPLWMSE